MENERDERSQPMSNPDEKEKAFKAATHDTDIAPHTHPAKAVHPKEVIDSAEEKNETVGNKSGDGFVEEPH